MEAAGLVGGILDFLSTLFLRSFFKSLGCEITCSEVEILQISVVLAIFIILFTVLFVYLQKKKIVKRNKKHKRFGAP